MDLPGADRSTARAAAANGVGATAVLADEPDPPPYAAPLDPTSVSAILRELAPEDLADPKRFEPFFHRLRRAGKAPNPERQLVSHFALALECRRVGRNPVGLFIARVEEGDWSKVKPDDFALAEIAVGKRDAAAPAEKARLEDVSEKKLGGRMPKDVPLELRDRFHATKPGTIEHQAACDAIVAWRREHEPGPRRVDPDAAGVSVASLVERMRERNAEPNA